MKFDKNTELSPPLSRTDGFWLWKALKTFGHYGMAKRFGLDKAA